MQQPAKSTLVDRLSSLWAAENVILDFLKQSIDAATDEGLKNILRLHYAETLNQTSALRGIFKQLDIQPIGEVDQALDDILEQQYANTDDGGDDQDMAIIDQARKIELYEISKYTSAAIQADLDGREGIRKTLLVTLSEEKLAKVKLDFVERSINERRMVTVRG